MRSCQESQHSPPEERIHGLDNRKWQTKKTMSGSLTCLHLLRCLLCFKWSWSFWSIFASSSSLTFQCTKTRTFQCTSTRNIQFKYQWSIQSKKLDNHYNLPDTNCKMKYQYISRNKKIILTDWKDKQKHVGQKSSSKRWKQKEYHRRPAQSHWTSAKKTPMKQQKHDITMKLGKLSYNNPKVPRRFGFSGLRNKNYNHKVPNIKKNLNH